MVEIECSACGQIFELDEITEEGKCPLCSHQIVVSSYDFEFMDTADGDTIVKDDEGNTFVAPKDDTVKRTN